MSVVLLAHAQPAIARVVEAVLALYGFEVHTVRTGDEARTVLTKRRFDALVVDVAVAGTPSFELIGIAKELAAQPQRGAPIVILVSSVYRKTSYKRRPARLYGADDYVEIHHIGDMLPDKLAGLLSIDARVDDGARADAETEAAKALRVEGDRRVESYDADEMAALVVADVVLYNGDSVAGTSTVEDARAAVSDDLDVARDLLEQLARASGVPVPSDDPIGRAFERIMAELGRKGASP